jgi:peptidoglycan/xylan/chitin deacetylase (PgdA/CDA1 family)
MSGGPVLTKPGLQPTGTSSTLTGTGPSGTTTSTTTVVAKPGLYLTFDDGPKDPATEHVLDALKAARASQDDLPVKATFFVCMKPLDLEGDRQFNLLKRMLTDGHQIGTHGYDHSPVRKREYMDPKFGGVAGVKQDFVDNNNKIADLFVRHKDTFAGFTVARLPGEGRTFSPFVSMITTEIALPHVAWDFEFSCKGKESWLPAHDWQGVKGIDATFPSLPKQDSILLLHDEDWAGEGALLTALLLELKKTFYFKVPLPNSHDKITPPLGQGGP